MYAYIKVRHDGMTIMKIALEFMIFLSIVFTVARLLLGLQRSVFRVQTVCFWMMKAFQRNCFPEESLFCEGLFLWPVSSVGRARD